MRTMNVFTRMCPMCGNKSMLTVSLDGFIRWQEGELIQEALPELDADQRELMITGVHAHCWQAAFGEGNDS